MREDSKNNAISILICLKVLLLLQLFIIKFVKQLDTIVNKKFSRVEIIVYI